MIGARRAAVVLAIAGCGVSGSGPPRKIDDGLTPVVQAPPPAPVTTDGADAGTTDDADAAPAKPPTAIVGLDVGGTVVPPEKLRVVLHVGHSNMAGRATSPDELRPLFFQPDPQLWSYRWEDPIAAMGPLRFRPAIEPLSPDPYTGPDAAGPGMALLRAALARAPGAFVVSIGRGQSGRDIGTCDAFRKGGLLWDATMIPAARLRGHVTFVGLFTMLGTTEFDSGRDPSHFADCLEKLAADVRGELGLPDLPVMVGGYEAGATGYYAPTEPGAMAVIAQLAMVPSRIARAALIPTEDLPMQDDHHYDLRGHQLWAQRALAIMADRGWAPWATATP